MRDEDQVPIMTESDLIHKDFGNNGYAKPATGLVMLREHVIEPEGFDDAFGDYSKNWMFKHPQPADFFRSMEEGSGENLAWFWRGWFYSTHANNQAINNVTVQGKKSTAERLFYGALGLIEERTGDDPVKVFKRAVENAKPQVEVKSRRVGGSTYQVPIEVQPDRQQALAIRWLIGYARGRSEKTMAERLAAELLAASRSEGSTIKKKEDTHRMAEANKAFAHYRW